MSIVNNKFFVLGSNLEGSEDPLRQILKTYWIQKDNAISFSGKLIFDDEGFVSTEYSAKFTIDKQELIDIEVEAGPGLTLRWPSIYQEILVRDNLDTGRSGPSAAYQAFLNEIDKIKNQDPVIFEDYTFSLDSPIVYPSSQDNQSKLEGDVDFVFNYGLENYESTIAPTDFNENSTLNYYDYFERKQATMRVDSSGRGFVWKAAHKDPLGDSNPTVSKLNVTTKLEDSSYVIKQPPQQNYFITSEDYEDAMNLKESVIGRLYAKEDKKGPIFPFYTKISFSSIRLTGAGLLAKYARNKSSSTTTGVGAGAGLLAKYARNKRSSITTGVGTDAAAAAGPRLTGDTDLLTKYAGVPEAILHPDQLLFTPVASYCSDLLAPAGNTEYFDKKAFSNSTLIPEYADALQTLFDENFTIESNTLNLVDVFLMVDNLYHEGSVNSLPPTKGYYRDASDETYMAKGHEDFKTILAGSLKVFLEEAEKKSYENVRTYTDILNAALSYESDIVFYKISKFDAGADGEGAIPIQNIWIPGNNGTSDKIVNYIDFQVKYGKRYTYKVYAYKFVIGTKYEYQIEDIVEDVEGTGTRIDHPPGGGGGRIGPGSLKPFDFEPPEIQGAGGDEEDDDDDTRRVVVGGEEGDF